MHWIREGPLRRWIHEGPIRYHPEPSTAMPLWILEDALNNSGDRLRVAVFTDLGVLCVSEVSQAY